MGSGKGRARRVRTRLPKVFARISPEPHPDSPEHTYPNEEFGREPVDVQLNGKHVLMPWQAPRGYRGNRGDMFWLGEAQEFVVLHNKYLLAKGPKGLGVVYCSGYKEVYRGSSLTAALEAIREIADLEGAVCSPTRAWVSDQADKAGFSKKLEPLQASRVEKVGF